MITKILNIGVNPKNNESLNRSVRISNLIAIITILTMLVYIPLAMYYNVLVIIILHLGFLISSILSLYYNKNNKHHLGVYISSIYGLLFFSVTPIYYGLSSNLHFYILIMCLIAMVLYNSIIYTRIFLVSSLVLFFTLILTLNNSNSLIVYTYKMEEIQNIISILNLFFLFIITITFFAFFKKENITFQSALINQKHIIEEKQKEILDSIHYANSIQSAFLANKELITKNLPYHFIYFKPKDIVSGDFYWATEHNSKFYLAICDCTGHGVPGAFMSLLNIGFLNEAVKEKNIEKPNEIFNYVRNRLIQSIGQNGKQDGMDAILLCFEYENNTIQKITYAAANNQPIVIRNNQIIELPKDKMPVGKGEKNLSFTLHTFDFQKNDTLYLYTDGFADQFGGPKGKKFMYKPLNNLLLTNSTNTLENQKQTADDFFETWKGNLEQVDDVCIVGIRI